MTPRYRNERQLMALIRTVLAFAIGMLLTNVVVAAKPCVSPNGKHPYCTKADSDPDGDGFGWEQEATCIVPNSDIDPKPGSCATLPAAAKAPAVPALDPKFFYFIQGQTIGGRGFSVGDPSNWSTQLVDKKGESKSGKISVEPEDFSGKGDALKITTSRKKGLGQLALYGPPVDLSSAKDLAALTFNVKVDQKPNSDVKVGMDCGWPCRAEVSIGKLLRKQEKGQWAALPIPLNCFKNDNFDLSKINGVFLLSTEGRMELSISDIRIERLPEGDKGCVE